MKTIVNTRVATVCTAIEEAWKNPVYPMDTAFPTKYQKKALRGECLECGHKLKMRNYTKHLQVRCPECKLLLRLPYEDMEDNRNGWVQMMLDAYREP